MNCFLSLCILVLFCSTIGMEYRPLKRNLHKRYAPIGMSFQQLKQQFPQMQQKFPQMQQQKFPQMQQNIPQQMPCTKCAHAHALAAQPKVQAPPPPPPEMPCMKCAHARDAQPKAAPVKPVPPLLPKKPKPKPPIIIKEEKNIFIPVPVPQPSFIVQVPHPPPLPPPHVDHFHPVPVPVLPPVHHFHPVLHPPFHHFHPGILSYAPRLPLPVFPPRTCPSNMIYSTCANYIKPSKACPYPGMSNPVYDIKSCLPGCVCAEGLIWTGYSCTPYPFNGCP